MQTTTTKHKNTTHAQTILKPNFVTSKQTQNGNQTPAKQANAQTHNKTNKTHI